MQAAGTLQPASCTLRGRRRGGGECHFAQPCPSLLCSAVQEPLSLVVRLSVAPGPPASLSLSGEGRAVAALKELALGECSWACAQGVGGGRGRGREGNLLQQGQAAES